MRKQAPGAAGWRCRWRTTRASPSPPGFELKGSARAGELTLFNPLGGTLAALAWGPGSATLRGNGQAREFDSVDALVAHATGSAIPVAALFDWLRGTNTPVPGWQADLSQLEAGAAARPADAAAAAGRPARGAGSLAAP